MKRTQIQLDEHTFEALRRRAFQGRQSLAGMVREILRAHVAPQAERMRRDASPFSFVASGRSRGKGAGTIAERHDAAFSHAIQKQK